MIAFTLAMFFVGAVANNFADRCWEQHNCVEVRNLRCVECESHEPAYEICVWIGADFGEHSNSMGNQFKINKGLPTVACKAKRFDPVNGFDEVCEPDLTTPPSGGGGDSDEDSDSDSDSDSGDRRALTGFTPVPKCTNPPHEKFNFGGHVESYITGKHVFCQRGAPGTTVYFAMRDGGNCVGSLGAGLEGGSSLIDTSNLAKKTTSTNDLTHLDVYYNCQPESAFAEGNICGNAHEDSCMWGFKLPDAPCH